MLSYTLVFALVLTFVNESVAERANPWFKGPNSRNHYIANRHKIPDEIHPTLDNLENINNAFSSENVYLNYDTLDIKIVMKHTVSPDEETSSHKETEKRFNLNQNKVEKEWTVGDLIKFRLENSLTTSDLPKQAVLAISALIQKKVEQDEAKTYGYEKDKKKKKDEEEEEVNPYAPRYVGTNQHTTNSSIPTSQTFLLHSNIGSNKTIYLNFLGGVLESNNFWIFDYNAYYGTNLSSFAYLPYSKDSNYSSFSQSELIDIITSWRIVASDFAPFDVDVTTEFPGLSRIDKNDTTPETFGSVLAVDGNSTLMTSSCFSCGGVALLSSFGRLALQPSWYFPKVQFMFSSNVFSHELGHTFGLFHQSERFALSSGSGVFINEYYFGNSGVSTENMTSWAPIMGHCDATRLYCTWSNGDYKDGLINKQDDMAILSSVLNYTKDDFSDIADSYLRKTNIDTTKVAGSSSYDYIENATSLRSDVKVRGLIHNSTDADSFILWLGDGQANVNVTIPTIETGKTTTWLTSFFYDYNTRSNLDPTLRVYRLLNGVQTIVGSSELIGYKNETFSMNVTNQAVGGGYYKFVVSASGVPGVSSNFTNGYPAYGVNGQYLLSLNFVTATIAEPV